MRLASLLLLAATTLVAQAVDDIWDLKPGEVRIKARSGPKGAPPKPLEQVILEAFDKNHDQKLLAAEVEMVLEGFAGLGSLGGDPTQPSEMAEMIGKAKQFLPGLFAMMDTDGSESLSLSELKWSARAAPPPAAEAKTVLGAVRREVHARARARASGALTLKLCSRRSPQGIRGGAEARAAQEAHARHLWAHRRRRRRASERGRAARGD